MRKVPGAGLAVGKRGKAGSGVILTRFDFSSSKDKSVVVFCSGSQTAAAIHPGTETQTPYIHFSSAVSPKAAVEDDDLDLSSLMKGL